MMAVSWGPEGAYWKTRGKKKEAKGGLTNKNPTQDVRGEGCRKKGGHHRNPIYAGLSAGGSVKTRRQKERTVKKKKHRTHQKGGEKKRLKTGKRVNRADNEKKGTRGRITGGGHISKKQPASDWEV